MCGDKAFNLNNLNIQVAEAGRAIESKASLVYIVSSSQGCILRSYLKYKIEKCFIV